ncbi:MAG: DNA topoisomerase I [Candidatus Terrybacteria bacterium RIFCSPLOWO2_01_FULL_58_14]|uniref:DNA topoisomerase 1 n=2 Tax=Candidatus Terryibacteriota TaxID=1817920 RepID=A0A1G2PZY8_9BACT|nr:MAG: DNA topoisomerase I [Candidatus Terrybacteria bacterium RIFCSPHIGHO2_01_FULL_58_15]OHA53329.1 MAG: DNA topoisomerase I [Candidatus Terrybacteria bacterium RIFCSPLOWO2_01_FULL_58_14]
MKLVIVESPTKAKTITRFLGEDYVVSSSYGHVRDLPKSKLGIDLEKDFAPQYVIPTRVRKRVNELRRTAAKADSVILATDEDREGEAIAWHLTEALGLGDPQSETRNPKIERIVFHEITEGAIREALAHPRKIAMPRVAAQQARRVLDRLVGYNLSPFLWKKVARGLSAGRVQSVAVRFVVEREREREAFTPQEYWTIAAELATDRGATLHATLIARDGTPLEKFALGDQDAAEKVIHDLRNASWTVAKAEEKERTMAPPPPFRTSTLQQEASRRLHFTAKQTMRLAQQLYEGVELDGQSVGLITYMRTDSLALSGEFLAAAQSYLTAALGPAYTRGPQHYKTKARGAQEAHEAIRPTDAARTPETLQGKIDGSLWKLYDLIWRRALASQMPPAKLRQRGLTIAARGKTHLWDFRASGSVLVFNGFTAVWPVEREDLALPEIREGAVLLCNNLAPTQHFTEPPPRYTEATLIKTLEEYGIGRPSTYAPILSTIQERGYTERDEARRLCPTAMGMLVNDLLVEHFPETVDAGFTAKMEEELDDVAEEKREWIAVVRDFWTPFSQHIEEKLATVERAKPVAIETDERCEKCGKPLVQKFGRFGPFLACSGFPECRNTKPLREERLGITCPKCEKGEVIPRRSKRGRRFFGCSSYPDCDFVAWDQPIDERCPECGSILVKTVRGLVKCSDKTCRYRKETPAPEE